VLFMSETTNSQRALSAQNYLAFKQYLIQKLQQQGGFALFDRNATYALIEQAIQKAGVSVNGSLKERWFERCLMKCSVWGLHNRF